MKGLYERLLLCILATMTVVSTLAVTPEDNLEGTIEALYSEIKDMQVHLDNELASLQDNRIEFWKHMGRLQQDIDKAVLVLYSQDDGNLFGVGLASEELHNVCESFNHEKMPFEHWLQSMAIIGRKHENLRTALQKVHQETLSPKSQAMVRQSIAMCDSMDRRFASLRDSIALDQARYQDIAHEIDFLVSTNSMVVDKLRNEIFQNNWDDLLTYWDSFGFRSHDIYYGSARMANNARKYANESDNARIDRWNRNTYIIAIILGVIAAVAMRYLLPKGSALRRKRRYYAFLVSVAVIIVSSWILPLHVDYNSYLYHVSDIYHDLHWFLFLLILSATLRLSKPGLGWSVLAYLPMIMSSMIVIMLSATMSSISMLKMSVPIILILFSLMAVLILVFASRRISRADYMAAFGSMGTVLLAMALSVMGYFYLSIILLLFVTSVMTYISGFVCFKYIFHKWIARSGPIRKLTLTHLAYPYYYVLAIVNSLYSVARIFNLSSWLTEQLATPFISMPQFGVISVSNILLLINLAVVVNYVIKLVKLILIRTDRAKYETGGMAVAVTIGTTLMWFGYVLTALYVLRINHSGVVAAIGGASLGLGFAMKDTFENFFCGLSLMASRARPGDIVECDGARGVIKKIGIISTQIQIEDGPIVSFPNRQIFARSFTNLTLNNRREIRHIIFDISDKSDLKLAKDLMLQASEGIEGVVDHDSHYVVMKFTSCGIVRLDYKCWIDSGAYLRTEPAVREAIFNAFRAHGIEIADFSQELDARASASIMSGNAI